jgi:DNA gyrase subunit A
MSITDKTGKVVAIRSVSDADDLIITTKDGITIRMSAADIRIMGRATQGVRVIRLDEGEEIADVALIRDAANEEEDAVVELNENGEIIANTETGDIAETPTEESSIEPTEE